MNKEFDLLVFVGRFQPFHMEHKRVIEIALQKSKHVLVLVGSAGKPRTIRNPFTYPERKEFIISTFLDEYSRGRIIIKPIFDKMYNDTAWVKQVQTVATKVALDVGNNGGFHVNGLNDIKLGLIGASKDKTSYYLKLFPKPTWDSVDVSIENEIHATSIRDGFLNGTLEQYQVQGSLLPDEVAKYLFKLFKKSEEYEILQKEFRHVLDYKKAWEAAPYPVKHLTVDAVVEQSGHILLVRRRALPGMGLWAIPGGHLEMDETTVDGAIRELREETGLKVPDAVLRGSIANRHLFDDPYRSTIGRVVTDAFHFKLKDDIVLPKVKIPKGEHGSEEVEKVKWFPISEIKEDMMFDDHYHIINFFLGVQ